MTQRLGPELELIDLRYLVAMLNESVPRGDLPSDDGTEAFVLGEGAERPGRKRIRNWFLGRRMEKSWEYPLLRQDEASHVVEYVGVGSIRLETGKCDFDATGNHDGRYEGVVLRIRRPVVLTQGVIPECKVTLSREMGDREVTGPKRRDRLYGGLYPCRADLRYVLPTAWFLGDGSHARNAVSRRGSLSL